MREVYCKGCKKKINTIPVLGEPFFKFEDGEYCSTCAKVVVDKRRKQL